MLWVHRKSAIISLPQGVSKGSSWVGGLKTWICLHCDDFAQMAPGLGNTPGEAALVRGVAHRSWVCEGREASVIPRGEYISSLLIAL